MALIKSGSRFVIQPLVKKILHSAQPACLKTSWTKDFKPGDYPATEEEKVNAARKYNLIPEDYKPLPDDGSGYGDYPDLPILSGASRDPYENYDYPNLNLNYGEPIPADYDIYLPARFDLTGKETSVISYKVYFLALLGIVVIYSGLSYISSLRKIYKPLKPKQYPCAGPHYTL